MTTTVSQGDAGEECADCGSEKALHKLNGVIRCFSCLTDGDDQATAALRADLARVTAERDAYIDQISREATLEAERDALAAKLGEALKHIADDDIRAQFASIDNAGAAAKGTP